MRAPVNPPPGGRQRITSVAVALTVDVWEQQPQDPNTAPLAQLPTVDGELRDDASQAVPRSMTLRTAPIPSWLAAGMWIRATVGVQTLQPIIYRLPVLCVTDIAEDLSSTGGAVITAADPGEIVNGRPYEADTVLSGTLRQLVADACVLALSRTTDVSAVPALPVPLATVAEFGAGRWDTCLSTADALGVALRFADNGDVAALVRAATPPAPAAIVERRVADGGTSHHVRAPTDARVLVTRGSDTVGLIGAANAAAITGVAPPPWYRPYVVTDRQNGDAATTQAQADTLAADLLRARLSELDSYESMPILPAPWLESGDVVEYLGLTYMVRAVTLAVPSLATAVTLRRLL